MHINIYFIVISLLVVVVVYIFTAANQFYHWLLIRHIVAFLCRHINCFSAHQKVSFHFRQQRWWPLYAKSLLPLRSLPWEGINLWRPRRHLNFNRNPTCIYMSYKPCSQHFKARLINLNTRLPVKMLPSLRTIIHLKGACKRWTGRGKKADKWSHFHVYPSISVCCICID